MIQFGIYLTIASVCLLAGAALGYYTAHADHERKTHEHPE